MEKSRCICSPLAHFKPVIVYWHETVFREYEGSIIGVCDKCGMLKTFPSRKNRLFNPRIAKCIEYEKRRREFEKMFMPLVGGLDKLIPKNADVLDVGCSSGILANMLRLRKYRVMGIEANVRACKVAKKKLGGKTVHCGTLSTFRKKNKRSFDCIIYNHVLEHVGNPASEIKLARKALKKNGILVVGVPNRDNWTFRIRKKYWEYLLPNEHVWHFSVHDVVRLAGINGFSPLSFRFEDDPRKGYPLIKRIYFFLMSLLNRIEGTGEAVLVFFRRI